MPLGVAGRSVRRIGIAGHSHFAGPGTTSCGSIRCTSCRPPWRPAWRIVSGAWRTLPSWSRQPRPKPGPRGPYRKASSGLSGKRADLSCVFGADTLLPFWTGQGSRGQSVGIRSWFSAMARSGQSGGAGGAPCRPANRQHDDRIMKSSLKGLIRTVTPFAFLDPEGDRGIAKKGHRGYVGGMWEEIGKTSSPRASGSRSGDEVAVGRGWGEDALLDDAGEAVGDAPGGAAVEAEDELVEVGRQMLLGDGAVVGAEQPALGQAEHQVDRRQAQRGIAPAGAEIERLVAVAGGGEAGVAGPAVGRHGRRPGDVLAEEALQALGRDVVHHGQAKPAQTAPLGLAAAGLDGTGDPGLAGSAAPRRARPRAADVGLVGLDPRGQRRPLRADHGAADLVQPAPGGLVAAEAHLALELHRRDAALARGHQVDRQEPLREAGLGLLEDGAGENRVLLAAGRALLDQALLVAPGLVMPAARAAKTRGPTRPHQIGPALRVRAEALQKARQIARQIPQQLVGHGAPPTSVFLLCSPSPIPPPESSSLSLVER